MEVSDETIKVTDQIVGVVWMKVQEGLQERVAQLGPTQACSALNKRSVVTFFLGSLLGAALSLTLQKTLIF